MNSLLKHATIELLEDKGFTDNLLHDGMGGSHYNVTISEAVMWLYKNHGIWIHCEICFDGNSFIPKITKVVENLYPYNTQLNSPSEAYEAAILYTLNKLI